MQASIIPQASRSRGAAVVLIIKLFSYGLSSLSRTTVLRCFGAYCARGLSDLCLKEQARTKQATVEGAGNTLSPPNPANVHTFAGLPSMIH